MASIDTQQPERKANWWRSREPYKAVQARRVQNDGQAQRGTTPGCGQAQVQSTKNSAEDTRARRCDVTGAKSSPRNNRFSDAKLRYFHLPSQAQVLQSLPIYIINSESLHYVPSYTSTRPPMPAPTPKTVLGGEQRPHLRGVDQGPLSCSLEAS
ncbi:hypothetical protein K402DRAFT_400338 [Aulographum hederae CBS 113979]|uniref:Uncharacterized protein n=1 Tax=Aulographum hederae CBS 113979 TaxID=1176131 RepID=A0A6G1HF04_9PEZI|nr:hypothetical protein K402DRAFT_400338 [Aulographum hederae CBS 113979]